MRVATLVLVGFFCAHGARAACETVPAATEPAASMSSEQAVALAKEKSPDVRSLQNQADSAAAKASAVFIFSEPSISIQYNDMDRPFHFGYQASTLYQITQPMPFPGKTFLGRASLRNQAHAVASQLRSMQLQVAANARSAYNGLALAQEGLRLNDDQRAAYERILAIARRRYESGAIPQVDLLNAQVALYSNDNDLSDLVAAERSARAQLNVILDKPPEFVIQAQPVRAELTMLPSLAAAERQMSENRAELQGARFQLKASDYAYDLAKASWLPDFQFVVGMTDYNEPTASPWNNTFPERTHTMVAGITATLPLWGLFIERQGIIGAAHDRAAAEANLRSVANQSLISLKSALETLAALAARIQNYEQHLLPLSEQALSIALVSYSAGKIDFQTLVDTASARRQARRDYLTAQVSYAANRSTLGQLIGEEL